MKQGDIPVSEPTMVVTPIPYDLSAHDCHHGRLKVTVSYFLLSLIFLLALRASSAHAAVAIKMSMEPVNTGSRSIRPGDGVRLRFKLIDTDTELIGGIMTDIFFDKEILSVSPDRDVKISLDMQGKKTLYSNLSRDNKLRVMLIGFNDRVIPHNSELFTATFTVLRKPASLPGTMVYQHASSTSSQGTNISTTANSLFIPVSDSTISLASLSGTVSEAGNGIPSALIGMVSKLQPEIFFQTLTDSAGNYSLTNVIEGVYTLVAVKGNYNSYLEKNVTFSPGDTLIKNITLTKGQIQFTFISPITPDEGTYYTSRSSITVSGVTPQNTASVLIQGKLVSDYTPGDLSWYTVIPLKIGENVINASALDKDSKSLGQSSIKIVVTSAGKFKITNPTDKDTYETQAAQLTIGGLTAPETATIESNGVRISGYSSGQTSWETSATLHQGINFLSFTARDASGKVVGTDSLSILCTQEGGGGGGSLTIINPASSGYHQTGQSTISIGGQAPSLTSSLTMNSTPLAGYLPGSVSWSTSSLTLAMGDNLFTFKAFDSGGNLLGETGITVHYQPGFVDKSFIIKVPTESSQYTAENQQLSLGGDTPSSTNRILVNGKTVSGYQAGSDSWSTTISLEAGENQIVVAAYNAQGEEIGSDSITIFFSLSFGDLFITQPTDAPIYQTRTKLVRLGGKTSPDTTEILINDQVLPGYQAHAAAWSYNASLALGKTTFTVLAYDLNKTLLGRDEIVITNPGVLEINRPTIEEDYVTGKKKLLLSGTVLPTMEEPMTSMIKINGLKMAGYTAGSPVWEQEIELARWESDFYLMAYDASGEMIGLDFLKVYLVDPSLARFRIDDPAEKVLILQKPTLPVAGETPFTTRRIYRNKTEISFQSGDHPSLGLVNIPWTDSVELSLGENPIEYQAIDESGQEIDRDGLLVIYTGIMRIIEPVADSMSYTTAEDTVHILVQIDNPARGSTLTINNALLPSYNGQSTVSYQTSLQEGENHFVFRLSNESGTPTGYSAITITRTSDIQQVKEKDKVGEGFCFIRSLPLSGTPARLTQSGASSRPFPVWP